MAGTAARGRNWQGPAVLSQGPRPFFLLAALWASLGMVAWVAVLSGRLPPTASLSPVAWHAHEMLFGYLGAVLAGFLLGAVPNRTGRLPVAGWPLAGLVLLWVSGRALAAVPIALPPGAVALADLSAPVTLAALLLREARAGGGARRNAVLPVLFAAFVAANGLFHAEMLLGGDAGTGVGLRIGLALAVWLIAFMGGKMIPSLTRNWLVRSGAAQVPVPPMRRFDRAALALLAVALAAWSGWPEAMASAALLAVAGVAQVARLMRWQGHRVFAEPLVWGLQAGFACGALGTVAMGLAVRWPGPVPPAAAQHLWTAGAIGVTTLVVMARTALAAGGLPPAARRGSRAMLLCLLGAVALRVLGPAGTLPVAGLLWIAVFFIFLVAYGPLLTLSRRGGRRRASPAAVGQGKRGDIRNDG